MCFVWVYACLLLEFRKQPDFYSGRTVFFLLVTFGNRRLRSVCSYLSSSSHFSSTSSVIFPSSNADNTKEKKKETKFKASSVIFSKCTCLAALRARLLSIYYSNSAGHGADLRGGAGAILFRASPEILGGSRASSRANSAGGGARLLGFGARVRAPWGRRASGKPE